MEVAGVLGEDVPALGEDLGTLVLSDFLSLGVLLGPEVEALLLTHLRIILVDGRHTIYIQLYRLGIFM